MPHLYGRSSASWWHFLHGNAFCDFVTYLAKFHWKGPVLVNTKRKRSEQVDQTSGIAKMKEEMGSFLNDYNRPRLRLLICDNLEIL